MLTKNEAWIVIAEAFESKKRMLLAKHGVCFATDELLRAGVISHSNAYTMKRTALGGALKSGYFPYMAPYNEEGDRIRATFCREQVK